jgi:hypothetical protein
MPWYQSRRLWWFCLSVAIVAWGWFDVRSRARIDPLNPTVHKTDVTVYTVAAQAMFAGEDPYEVSNPRGWHYLYPPILAILMYPIALLPSTEQAFVWFLCCTLCVIGSVVESRKLWRWWSGEIATIQIPAWLSWGLLAAMFFPVLNCLQRGQVGVVLLYFLLLGCRLILVSQSRWLVLLGGVVLALPVAIKLTPLLPAAVLAGGLLFRDLLWNKNRPSNTSHSQRDWRGALTCVGGCLGLLVWLLAVPAMTVGGDANAQMLRTWVARVVSNNDVGVENDFHYRSKRNQSLANGVWRLGNFVAYQAGWSEVSDERVDQPNVISVLMPMDESQARFIAPLVSLIGLVALTWLMLRAAYAHDLRLWPAIFGLGCLASLVVSPLSWGHHYAIAWPAALFVPAILYQQGKTATAQRMVWSFAALFLLHYIGLNFAGRIGLLGIGAGVWFLAAVYQVTMCVTASMSAKTEQSSGQSTTKSTTTMVRRAA